MTVVEASSNDFNLLVARWEELSNQVEQQVSNNMQKHRSSRISATEPTSEDLKKLHRLSSITSITSLGSTHSSFVSWIPFTRRRQPTDGLNTKSEPTVSEPISNSGQWSAEKTQAKGTGRTPMKHISGNINPTGHHAEKQPRPSLPRSSTFSHLPISTASRQPSETRPPLVSSQTTSALPSNRIPTPTTVERSRMQYQPKPLPTTPKRNGSSRPPRASSIQRSSTQPALPTIEATPPSAEKPKKEIASAFANTSQHALLHQSAAAAERIFKPMSDDDMWKKIEEAEYDAEDESRIVRKTAPNPTPRRATNLPKTDEHAGIYYVTPTTKPMRRGESQPIVGHDGPSKHRPLRPSHGIAQRQLLQPLLPPTPPALQSPPHVSKAKINQIKSIRSVSTTQLGSPPNDSPSSSRSSPAPTTPHPLLQVSTSQPSSYWAGRLLSLSDHLQSSHASSALSSQSTPSSRPASSIFSNPSSSSSRSLTATTTTTPSSSSLHLCANPLDIALESDAARARSALTILFAYCTSPEAVDSLRDFQRAYAARVRLPEIALPIPRPRIERVALEVGMVREEVEWVRNSAGVKVGRGRRKVGFWVVQKGEGERVDEDGGVGRVKSPGVVAVGEHGGGSGSGSGSGRKFSFVERLIGRTKRVVS